MKSIFDNDFNCPVWLNAWNANEEEAKAFLSVESELQKFPALPLVGALWAGDR